MYYVYFLQSQKNGRIYFGYTNDLRRRVSEHNSGGGIYTKNLQPWTIIYYEAYASQKDAQKRERQLKKQRNAVEFIKKRIIHSLSVES